MIKITDKRKCCGCSACYSVCPNGCIVMERDAEGFLYPKVLESSCVNCGLCEKACPVLNASSRKGVLEAYAVQHKDNDILGLSASGGAFTAIAEQTIHKGGIAYGAAYDEDFVVKHTGIESKEQLTAFSSSKYVQSEQDDSFSKIKSQLEAGREVFYSGTPCQVAGLKSFLRKDYENLLTVDLVCKGVSSPLVLNKYVAKMESKYGCNISYMNFKKKTYGYHSSTMSVDFTNGKSYSKGGITDPMMRSFRANICLRPSCAECAFKGEERLSDITLFDCWHYQTLTGKKDDDRGHTAVLIHSAKGKERVLSCVNSLEIEKIDASQAITLDGVMVNNLMSEHPDRNEFMKYLSDHELEETVQKFIPISMGDRLKDGSKGILYKLHLLDLIKKM